TLYAPRLRQPFRAARPAWPGTPPVPRVAGEHGRRAGQSAAQGVGVRSGAVRIASARASTPAGIPRGGVIPCTDPAPAACLRRPRRRSLVPTSQLVVATELAHALARRIGEPRYKLWFERHTCFVPNEREGVLTVGVPNRHFEEWLHKTFAADVAAAA